MKYLLDSNFFIEAHRVYYPLDVVESFWITVKKLAEEDKIFSIDKVRNEIFRNEDKLTEWIKENLPEQFFVSTETDELFFNCYTDVINWAVNETDYTDKAKDEFAEEDKADAWLIAFAKCYANQEITIVTSEKSAPQKKSKIKIPDACKALNVPCIDTIEMFRQLEVKF